MPNLSSIRALANVGDAGIKNASNKLQSPRNARTLSASEAVRVNLGVSQSNRLRAWSNGATDAITNNIDRALGGITILQGILSEMQSVAADAQTGAYSDPERAATHGVTYTNDLLPRIGELMTDTVNAANVQILNNAAMGTVVFGSNATEVITLPTIDLRVATLTIDASPTTVANAATALGQLDTAIRLTSNAAASLGAFKDILTTRSQELTARKGDIDDAVDAVRNPDLDQISNIIAELAKSLQVLRAVSVRVMNNLQAPYYRN